MSISTERLTELLKAERTLNALVAGGVDNWDGYDFALEAIRGEEEYEEFLEEVAEEIMDAISECIEEPAGQGAGYGVRTEGYTLCVEILKKHNLAMPTK